MAIGEPFARNSVRDVVVHVALAVAGVGVGVTALPVPALLPSLLLATALTVLFSALLVDFDDRPLWFAPSLRAAARVTAVVGLCVGGGAFVVTFVDALLGS